MGYEFYLAAIVSVCFWILIELSSIRSELKKMRIAMEKEGEK